MSHFPDLDAIPELIRRGRVSASSENPYDHREGLHYPLVLVSLGVLAMIVVPYWGHMFLVATLLHLVNDFYGTGWGIKLLWPISNSNYKLLGRRVNRLKYLLADSWSDLPDSEKKLRLVVSWDRRELPDYIEKWGMDYWIEQYYLKLNWICVTEYVLFAVAVVLSVYSLI
tara:strand:+ start:4672 stop:5181 length:510 start_codon:yes stop_codon:yes gene_type:complete